MTMQELLAQALVWESEEFFRLITGSIHDAIFVTDLEGRLVFANKRAEAISGYRVEEFRGKELWCILVPDTLAQAQARLDAVRAGETPSPILEGQIIRKDGSLAWVEVSASNIEQNGRVVGRLGVVRDVTDRRRVEDNMRLQSAALEAAVNGILITDREGTIIWTNPGFTQLTGYDADEAVGRTPGILKSGRHDAPFYHDLWQTIRSGRAWHGEIVNRRKDGSLYHEEQTITPVRGRDGEITHFIAIKQDITARKRLTDRLVEQQK